MQHMNAQSWNEEQQEREAEKLLRMSRDERITQQFNALRTNKLSESENLEIRKKMEDSAHPADQSVPDLIDGAVL